MEKELPLPSNPTALLDDWVALQKQRAVITPVLQQRKTVVS